MTDILMPALSPTMEEGTLTKWHIKAGDTVKAGDVIAEIETDKATMEVEAVDEGEITDILVAEGSEGVKVNTPIARLAGEEVPAWDDIETGFDDLIARVDRAVAYVEGLDASKFEGAEDRDITLTRRGETSVVKGLAYFQTQAQPNFFFHLTTAYAILRKNGVEVGKRDYLGSV